MCNAMYKETVLYIVTCKYECQRAYYSGIPVLQQAVMLLDHTKLLVLFTTCVQISQAVRMFQ